MHRRMAGKADTPSLPATVSQQWTRTSMCVGHVYTRVSSEEADRAFDAVRDQMRTPPHAHGAGLGRGALVRGPTRAAMQRRVPAAGAWQDAVGGPAHRRHCARAAWEGYPSSTTPARAAASPSTTLARSSSAAHVASSSSDVGATRESQTVLLWVSTPPSNEGEQPVVAVFVLAVDDGGVTFDVAANTAWNAEHEQALERRYLDQRHDRAAPLS
eukprot:TRINITY_DN1980_c1_g1_i3.p1 TRINITY_DN1980_c1_g1~~TRINITY_DN1980_c1_g1_i3.p1  ORF type:complete len:214 (+),score=13.59 TRINITY_DN1980_c1_g1_i3:246-887(+)